MMQTSTITLTALQDIMQNCPRSAKDAAAIALLYDQDPADAQKQAKDLVRRVMASGDVGGIPAERIRGLAIWATLPPTKDRTLGRSVVQMRITPADKMMLQELADAQTDGNLSKLIRQALKAYAGIEF
jgi:hypothetical protein